MFDCAWKVSDIHGTNMTDTRNEWQNAYLVLVFELSSIFLLLSFLRPLFNGRLSAGEEIKKREDPNVNGMSLKKFRDEWVFWRCSRVFSSLELVFIYQVLAR